MLKRLVIGLTLYGMIFSTTALAEPCLDHAETYEVETKAAVVCELSTGRVLYALNPNEKLAMASTTKIMTTLLALEQPNLEEEFVVDTDAIHVEGSSMGLVEGDTVSLLALAHGMIIPSGNDAANATAVRIAGTAEKYVEMMNQKAEELGLTNTHFVTPSGLDADGHYSTALDMARLSCEAMKNPVFRSICSQYNAKVTFGNPPFERWLKNHNKLLDQDSRCIGIKTGFTGDAGRCLVSAARNDEDEELLVVTLNCPNDWEVHKNFYDDYFSKMKMMDASRFIDDLTVPVTGGMEKSVEIESIKELSIPMFSGESHDLTHKINLNKFEYAPVCKGDCLGNIEFYIDGELVLSSNLVAKDDVPQENKNKVESIIDRIKGYILKLV